MAGRYVSEDNEERRARVRSRAWALGLLVLLLYVGFIVLMALRIPGALG